MSGFFFIEATCVSLKLTANKTNKRLSGEVNLSHPNIQFPGKLTLQTHYRATTIRTTHIASPALSPLKYKIKNKHDSSKFLKTTFHFQHHHPITLQLALPLQTGTMKVLSLFALLSVAHAFSPTARLSPLTATTSFAPRSIPVPPTHNGNIGARKSVLFSTLAAGKMVRLLLLDV